jgi:NAD(P)-dependent dehydrogenase (short-subunit alcohol dehydrogenase family)
LPLLATGSSITFLSSGAGIHNIRNTSAYAASKAAVNALTGVLAVELADLGIRVNAVAPGFTATPMNAELREDPAIAEFTISITPLGRLAQVNDIAPAIVFLASDAARFISGVILPVTGGYPNAFSAAGSTSGTVSGKQTQTESQ